MISKDKSMPLAGEAFLRRFLMHVLPKDFMRIRHYGFLANRCRQQKLTWIRQCLQRPSPEPSPGASLQATQQSVPATKKCRCPQCHQQTLWVCYEIAPIRYARGQLN